MGKFYLKMAVQQTVGQRFTQLIQALGMSKNAFALSLDKTATVIQHIVEERNKPGFDLLCKVFEVYPNVSKDWLLQGNGSMFPYGQVPVEPETAQSTQVTPLQKGDDPVTVATEPVAPTERTSAVAAEPASTSVPDAVVPPVAVAPPVLQAPVSVAPAPAPAPAPGWEAALYAQQLQHQLALADMRNQHLLEQQKMLQQMVELLRQTK
ncbi:helix-turn-helix transcriptional regulator [Hymenobacter sp. CRA2]|uniref:helix-turn-helix transcriptional regulator n=1 Tax=Hymenobacter sp. CRA2 TaxID=1955620 RepID=UPI00111625AD|nr:helix-turn-helix transcriptional regulator [Hymenobacter sp. CRA2]